jgi:hypothetical protein
VSSITIVRGAHISSVVYNHHSDDSRGVIYNRNVFMVQDTGANIIKLSINDCWDILWVRLGAPYGVN